MKHILRHLYYGFLNESERYVKALRETEEYRQMTACYKKFAATFTDGQRELYQEFDAATVAYFDLEQERVYSNGFKTGVWLTFEFMDFQLRNDNS
ncbi:MAG: hypothetical protein IJX88_01110 [Clostridia bacterium]|nr:hypothetical protein [Clostridia bacterium]